MDNIGPSLFQKSQKFILIGIELYSRYGLGFPACGALANNTAWGLKDTYSIGRESVLSFILLHCKLLQTVY